MIIPDAMQALLALGASVKKNGVPSQTLDLVNLRASQINGCSVCVDMHSRDLKKAGETGERLFAVAAWRDNPCFTEEERAALRCVRPSPGSATGRIQFPMKSGRRPHGTMRKGARGPYPRYRQHQRLESAQCRSPAGGGRLEGLSAAIFFFERTSNRTNSVSESADAAENPVPAVLSEDLISTRRSRAQKRHALRPHPSPRRQS
jgi:AhpD family alkylhydroperoxidase